MDSFLKFLEDNCPGDDAHDGYAQPNKPLLERCGMCASIHEAHLKEMNLQVGELQKQLRTAQEVIEKHVSDQLEGLHCVDCVAEPDETCDCPMLVPMFEAMKGYEPKPITIGGTKICDKCCRMKVHCTCAEKQV